MDRSILALLMAVMSFNIFAQGITPSVTTAVVSAPASSDEAAQLALKKWGEKEKFSVVWTMGSSTQSFTAYPKKGEFTFHSSDFCERGVHKAEYFAKDGKFMIKVVRAMPGCIPAVMIFEPSSSEGVAAEEVGGQYSVLPGRKLYLKE